LSGSIPSSFTNLPTLETLFLNDNRLSGSIPAIHSRTRMNLSYNYFTFDAMEFIAETFTEAIYDHQKDIPVNQNGNTLSVSAGGTLSNNTYKLLKWTSRTTYTVVATKRGDSVFHPADSGIYQIKILNSVATGLVLYSKVIKYVAPSNPVIASSENTLQEYNKANVFRVYPNPARDVLHIEANGNASVSLIDQSGKILMTTNINSKGSIDVSNINPGLYYIKNNSTQAVRKVVIER
jgi:hypothetical protein